MIKIVFISAVAILRALSRRIAKGPAQPSWSIAFEVAIAVDRAILSETASWPTSKIQRTMKELPGRLARQLTVSEVELGGRPAERSHLPGEEPASTLLYLHGGGFVQGSPGTHRDAVSAITLAAGCQTYSLDYRLASQHPFPAASDDVYSAYRDLLEQGVAPESLAVAGDSAGGTLTLVLLQRLRDEGLPLPAAAVPICPAPDLGFPGKSWNTSPHDCMTREMCEIWIGHYLNGHDVKDPAVSPIHGSFQGLPPMLVQAGGLECLYDDIASLVARIESEGAEVQFSVYPEMPHVWHLFHALTPDGKRALDEIGSFVRTHTEKGRGQGSGRKVSAPTA